MRIFPPINRTTLDSFHRDVYRPRLALLLLILLLILGQQQQQHTNLPINSKYHKVLVNSKTGKWSVIEGSNSNKIISILNKLPDRIRFDKSIVAVKWSNTKKKDEKEMGKQEIVEGEMNKKKKQSSSSSKLRLAFGAGNSGRSGKRKKEESYKSILKKVLNADALSALISLHILWAIRLASMILEDGLGKESATSTTTKSNSALNERSILGWIGISTSLAIFSTLFSWSSFFERIGLAQQAEFGSPSFSINIIIILELIATLISFSPTLLRLNDQSKSSRRKISLPSPSHSPSLIDLLPIPTGLANAFKAPREDTMMYRRRMAANPQFHGRPRHHHHPLAFSPIRVGDLTGADFHSRLTDNPSQQQIPTGGLAEPLRLPSSSSQSSSTTTRTAGKQGTAPKIQGMKVNVELNWLMENFVILFGHLIGSLQYFIVILSLPTLAPTSFPSLLAFLSLRSELGTVVVTWCSARKSVECLEFVQRRWSQNDNTSSSSSSVCAMCFEIVDPAEDPEDCCTLDCGHQLHSICLVQWLTKQAFCPCCHSTLKATPPSMRNATTTAVNP